MFKSTPLAIGALALGLSVNCHAAKDIDGYRSERSALAAQMPVYLVTLNARVRPQVAFGGIYPGANLYLDGMTNNMAQSLQPMVGAGPAIVAGALGGAIGNAILRAAAIDEADKAYAPLLRNQCDLPVDAPLQDTVRTAIARASWGANAQPILVDGSVKGWEKQIPKDRPRQVVVVSSSMAPGAAALTTTIDISAYTPEGQSGGKGWQKKPLWRDHLIVVSDVMELPLKTEADITRMVSEEEARYVESGDAEIVAGVAKDMYGASKNERSRAVTADRRHQTSMRSARASKWGPFTQGPRRAELWSQNECAPMRAAVESASSESARMLDDLYAQRLPARLPSKAKVDAVESAGPREIRALPGGVYISRNDGGLTPLAFRYSLLAED